MNAPQCYITCTLPVLLPLQSLNHYIFVQTSIHFISFSFIIKIYDIKFAPLINNTHVKINIHCITNTHDLFCLSVVSVVLCRVLLYAEEFHQEA
jgi:hypothetical protein